MAKSKKQPFPERISPMLATLTKEPFTHHDWLYEIKWDGYRVVAEIRSGKATLYSREGQNYTNKYKAIADELNGLPDCILDGEVVVLDDEGKPDFGSLQNYHGQGNIAYYIFDLLYYDGEDYMKRPLLQRKEMLLHIITKESILSYSDHFEDGIGLFREIQKLGMEGIIAKRKESKYQPGKRSNDWLKIKHSARREYVIGGWSESENTKSFRSILFGEYVNDKLRYVHHSGGGYTTREKNELFTRFKALEINKCPFVNRKDILIDTALHWIKPEMIGEFEISDKVTAAGIIRHPAIFKGLRLDKKPHDVTPEVTIDVRKEIKKVREQNLESSTGSWEILDKQKIISEDPFEVEGVTINLTNIERNIWKNVTKADLIQFYISVSDYILPFLKDRPLGINISLFDPADSFFIRGMEGRAPKWANIFKTERKHKKAGKSDQIEWLICNDLKTLIYIINLNCIDIHPWASRRQSHNNPDYITIDLDPTDNDFKKVIKTAKAAKQLFDGLKLTSFAKTSGKTGMHLLLPCTGIAYGQSRKIAENLCQKIHELVPAITTTLTGVNSRGDLLYVDPSQNDYGDRIAAPYCLRAFHIPTVSTPLEWKEVKDGLNPEDFNIKSIGARLKKKGDIWAGILEKNVMLKNGKILLKLLMRS